MLAIWLAFFACFDSSFKQEEMFQRVTIGHDFWIACQRALTNSPSEEEKEREIEYAASQGTLDDYNSYESGAFGLVSYRSFTPTGTSLLLSKPEISQSVKRRSMTSDEIKKLQETIISWKNLQAPRFLPSKFQALFCPEKVSYLPKISLIIYL